MNEAMAELEWVRITLEEARVERDRLIASGPEGP